MFFAALIGSYLVLRFGVPASQWPRPETFGLELWVGGLNTVILIASSIVMTWAVHASFRNRAIASKAALLVALLLGTVFLAIKSYEYREKFEQGLYPRPQSPLVFPRYGAEYLAAVRAEIQRLRSSAAAEQQDLVAMLDRVQLGLVDWAAREYARTTNESARESLVYEVAHLIRPQSDSQFKFMVGDLYREYVQLSFREQSWAQRRGTLQAELDVSMKELSALSDDVPQNQRAELEKRILDQRSELAAATNVWSPISDRVKFLESLLDLETGINATYNIRLPVVIPGGRTWLYGYFLLTGAHALHLLAGIIAGLVLVPFRLDQRRNIWVGNVAAYWNFVDAVWLVLFPIIYLL